MNFQIEVGGKWRTCEFDFQEIDFGFGIGTLVCPRLSQVCPDLFCPFNCAGRGVCNYEANINGTIRPQCECFDQNDTSAGCSDSLIPPGNFLDDSTGLFDNIEETFFDPFISVFVDHPSKWTSASWAWAAGLLAVLLILLVCLCSSLCPKRRRPTNVLPSRRRKRDMVEL